MFEKMPDKSEILKKATGVFDIEIQGLQTLRDELGDEFVTFIRQCLAIFKNNGKLVLSGIGKSGHISKKIAATLASTGSRSVFMHPVEAMHGDLGIVAPQDMLVAVSYSGETDELLAVLPAVKRLGVPIFAITAASSSRLGKFADFTLPMPVPREACPFNLAPTTTTTALAALGDAIAITLMYCHKFKINDYAKYHPSGAIGRSITLTVKDFMRTGEQAATVNPGMTVREALLAMTAARTGAVAVVEQDGTLIGIFTDGDFRRCIMKDPNALSFLIEDAMTENPVTINENKLAVDIMKILEHRKIDDVIAVDDDGHFAGLVDIQDLPKFKVM
ncbi:MAG: KpsF/GutQ family sugar-phosphate isomerase [Lentisphaeria bacterium]